MIYFLILNISSNGYGLANIEFLLLQNHIHFILTKILIFEVSSGFYKFNSLKWPHFFRYTLCFFYLGILHIHPYHRNRVFLFWEGIDVHTSFSSIYFGVNNINLSWLSFGKNNRSLYCDFKFINQDCYIFGK